MTFPIDSNVTNSILGSEIESHVLPMVQNYVSQLNMNLIKNMEKLDVIEF